MRKYDDLARHADPPFLGDFDRKIAARYRMMAKEALDLAEAKTANRLSALGGELRVTNGSLGICRGATRRAFLIVRRQFLSK